MKYQSGSGDGRDNGYMAESDFIRYDAKDFGSGGGYGQGTWHINHGTGQFMYIQTLLTLYRAFGTPEELIVYEKR